MDIINLLPSPPHFFKIFFKLALSLLNSSFNASHRRTIEAYRSPADFDVDAQTGFFPRHPLPHLPATFSIWETALEEANGNIGLGEDDSEEGLEKRPYGEAWRSKIANWPVLDTTVLQDELRLLQRAHLVLAWLVNLYVHSIPPSEDKSPIRVPKSLAVPLVDVSRRLGFAPVLTFADTVLWNWEPIRSDQPISIDNIRFTNLFSGKEDERNFYVASARAELRGVEMLKIIDDFLSIPNFTDLTTISKVSRDLTRLTGIIEDIKEIIETIRPTCDPHVFYWDVRPWFEGSDAKGDDGPGWIYEGVEDSDDLDLSGPSAGQSSVMHALDIFLDIDHKLQHRRFPAPSDANKRADRGFMDRMRRYMPGKHRQYLAHLAESPQTIRELAQRIPALREPYNTAVLTLKRLRDAHMRVACLYIVSMSRSQPPSRGCPASAMIARMQSDRASGKGPVRGTGGNELSALLKAGRDATRRAALTDN
ncbi:Indoleamine 2,3-dioxygenase [Infundibulicybe gibba]|nr:Indoleamine 2,3-dioxygenase [Infundibulicybe gibba]